MANNTNKTIPVDQETVAEQRVAGSVYMPAPPRRNIAFSGADVNASILTYGKISKEAYIPITNLAAISCSVHRDKAPVRRLGEASAKSYTKGTRTIAGSIVLVNFDRAGFYELIASNQAGYRSNNLVYGDTSSLENGEIAFSDEIPPFDIMLLFKEEKSIGDGFVGGKSKLSRQDSDEQVLSKMLIKNVRLVDEGVVTGTDEAYLETTFQYVAEDLEYLRPTDVPDTSIPESIDAPSNSPIEIVPAEPYRLFGYEKGETFYNIQKPEEFIWSNTRVEVVPLTFWTEAPREFAGSFDVSINRIPGTCSGSTDDPANNTRAKCEADEAGSGASPGTWAETKELLEDEISNFVGNPDGSSVYMDSTDDNWKAFRVYVRPEKVPPYFDDPNRTPSISIKNGVNATPTYISSIDPSGIYTTGPNSDSRTTLTETSLNPLSTFDFVNATGQENNAQIDGVDARFLIMDKAYLTTEKHPIPGWGNKFGVHEFFNIKGPKYTWITEAAEAAPHVTYTNTKYKLNKGEGKYYFNTNEFPIREDWDILGSPGADYIKAYCSLGDLLVEKVNSIDPADDYVFADENPDDNTLIRVTLGGTDDAYVKSEDLIKEYSSNLELKVATQEKVYQSSTAEASCSDISLTSEAECIEAGHTWNELSNDAVGNLDQKSMRFSLPGIIKDDLTSGPLMSAKYWHSSALEEVRKSIKVELIDAGTPIDLTDKIITYDPLGKLETYGANASVVGVLVPSPAIQDITAEGERDLTQSASSENITADVATEAFEITTPNQKLSISEEQCTITDPSGAVTGIYANLIISNHTQDFSNYNTTFAVEGFLDTLSETYSESNVKSGFIPQEQHTSMDGMVGPYGTTLFFPDTVQYIESITEVVKAEFDENTAMNYFSNDIASQANSILNKEYTPAAGTIEFTPGENGVTILGIYDPIESTDPYEFDITQLEWTSSILTGTYTFPIKSEEGVDVGDHYNYFIDGWGGNNKVTLNFPSFTACTNPDWDNYADCVAEGTCSNASEHSSIQDYATTTYENDKSGCTTLSEDSGWCDSGDYGPHTTQTTCEERGNCAHPDGNTFTYNTTKTVCDAIGACLDQETEVVLGLSDETSCIAEGDCFDYTGEKLSGGTAENLCTVAGICLDSVGAEVETLTTEGNCIAEGNCVSLNGEIQHGQMTEAACNIIGSCFNYEGEDLSATFTTENACVTEGTCVNSNGDIYPQYTDQGSCEAVIGGYCVDSLYNNNQTGCLDNVGACSGGPSYTNRTDCEAAGACVDPVTGDTIGAPDETTCTNYGGDWTYFTWVPDTTAWTASDLIWESHTWQPAVWNQNEWKANTWKQYTWKPATFTQYQWKPNVWTSAGNMWWTYPAEATDRDITVSATGITVDIADIHEKLIHLPVDPIQVSLDFNHSYADFGQMEVTYKQYLNNETPPQPTNTFEKEITLTPSVLNPDGLTHYELTTEPIIKLDGIQWDTNNIEDLSAADGSEWKFKIKNIPIKENDAAYEITADYTYKWKDTNGTFSPISIKVNYEAFNFDPTDETQTSIELDFGAYKPLFLHNDGTYHDWDWDSIKGAGAVNNWRDYLQLRCENSKGLIELLQETGADGVNPITVTTPAQDNAGNWKATINNIPLLVKEDATSWLESIWNGIWGIDSAPRGHVKATANAHFKDDVIRSISFTYDLPSFPASEVWDTSDEEGMGINMLEGTAQIPNYSELLGVDYAVIIPETEYDDFVDWSSDTWSGTSIREIEITSKPDRQEWDDIQGSDIADLTMFDITDYSDVNNPPDTFTFGIQHIPLVSDTINLAYTFKYMANPLPISITYLHDSGEIWPEMPIKGDFALETEVPIMVTKEKTKYNLDKIESVNFVTPGDTTEYSLTNKDWGLAMDKAWEGGYCKATDIVDYNIGNEKITKADPLRRLFYHAGLHPEGTEDTPVELDPAIYMSDNNNNNYSLEVGYKFIEYYNPEIAYTKAGYVMTARLNSDAVEWDSDLDEKYKKDWELAVNVNDGTLRINTGEAWEAGNCTNTQVDLSHLTRSECQDHPGLCSDAQWINPEDCEGAGTCSATVYNNDRTMCLSRGICADDQGNILTGNVDVSDCAAPHVWTAYTWTSAGNEWEESVFTYPVDVDKEIANALGGSIEYETEDSDNTPPGTTDTRITDKSSIKTGKITGIKLQELSDSQKLIQWGFWLIGSETGKAKDDYPKIFVNPERYGTLNEAIMEMQKEYQKKFFNGSFCGEEIRNDLGTLERFDFKKEYTTQLTCEKAGFSWYR